MIAWNICMSRQPAGERGAGRSGDRMRLAQCVAASDIIGSCVDVSLPLLSATPDLSPLER